MIAGNSLKSPASTTYAHVFTPHHNRAIGKAVVAGMYALPTKAQLLTKLNEDAPEVVEKPGDSSLSRLKMLYTQAKDLSESEMRYGLMLPLTAIVTQMSMLHQGKRNVTLGVKVQRFDLPEPEHPVANGRLSVRVVE
ncbi:hypothetical protein AgCh_005834 [Apium graveolens]